MKNNSRCQRWANHYSENLPDRDKEKLMRHTQICSTCQEAYEEYQKIHNALQSIPHPEPLPNGTFRQLLAKEQVRVEEKQSVIRKQDLVLASLYGICVPIGFYAIFSFIWSQCENLLKIFPGFPSLTSIVTQALVIYALNILTCYCARAFLQGFYRKPYKVPQGTHQKGLLVFGKRGSDVKLYIKLTRQIAIIVAMCLALLTSCIFAYRAGINLDSFLPLLIVGLVPHYVSKRRRGEISRLRVQAIFWGIVIEAVPRSRTQFEQPIQLEHSMPFIRLIADTAKSMRNLQWV